MKRRVVLAVVAALSGFAVSEGWAQSGDPDRIVRQEALGHAAAIENAWRSVEARIGVTDAGDLWEDEWNGLSDPPSGDWWLQNWTDRGLTARYCDEVLAVYAADDELKGVGRDQRAVQVAPYTYDGGRTGLQIVLRGGRLYEGSRGREGGSLPGCMPVPSTSGDRVALVAGVDDPKLTAVGVRWDTEDRTLACAAPDTGTFTERRRIPIQTTAVTNCAVSEPNCNDLIEFAGSPPAWPAACADRETMLSATPPELEPGAACSDWIRWDSNCQIVYAQAPQPTPIQPPSITWEDGPEHTWTTSCSCSCSPGDIVSGSCTEHWAQSTEWRVFVLRPGEPEIRTRYPAAGRTPSNLGGQPRHVNTVSSCSCTTPPPQSCPPGQVGTPPNCTTPPPGQTCPAGQVGTPPNCTTPPPGQTCPAGQVGTPPNCTTPPPGQTCPAGQTGTPPNCTKPPKDPPRKPDECEDSSCGEGGDEGTSDTESGPTSTDTGVPEQDTVSDPNFGGPVDAPTSTNDNNDDEGNGGNGGGKPIVLDLDGDGVELVPLEESTAFFDMNGDGYRTRMAWAAADDGFLVYDRDGDGMIEDRDELSFMTYVENAETDLEGLRHFDTDSDGQLDPDDAGWDMFRVWRDLDQDGESDPGELQSLNEAGIESVSLTSDSVKREVAGSTVYGEGVYVGPRGPRAFWDVSLRIGEPKQ